MTARFVIDTSGRPIVESFTLISSSHPLFTTAVRDVLPRLRFTPSRVRGRAVSMTAELPFTFHLER